MQTLIHAAVLAAGLLLAAPGPDAAAINFDSFSAGALPPGWEVGATSPAPAMATWRVVEDADAPSPPNVLTLTSPNHDSRPTFNLCWTKDVRFHEGEVEVSLRANAGQIDQGGGVAWRIVDADNYYICRANPLESNFRVYHVVAGKRTMLASADVKTTAGAWHTIRVEHRGDRIRCFLDGEALLEATDATLAAAGGVGLWTKADAATSFDDLRVRGR